MKTYVYKGDGAGIPGLPHRLTEEEAANLPAELAKQFRAALDAGVYAEESAGRVETESVKPRPQPARKPTASASSAEKE